MTFLSRILRRGQQPRELTDAELEALCREREESERRLRYVIASLDAEARSRGSR